MSNTLDTLPPGRYELFIGPGGVTVLRPVEDGPSKADSLSKRFPAGTLSLAGQSFSEQGAKDLARRRFQNGTLILRGNSWVGRWREDVIEAGHVTRVRRSEVLGALADFPTRKLALRELRMRLETINDPRYRARPSSTFAEFSSRWESTVLSQHKPSTRVNMSSHLRKHLIPFFGTRKLRDIETSEVQRFISSVKVSPKTVRNLYVTMQLLWKSARSWGYVTHNAIADVVLPKRHRTARRFFTLEEILRILAAAPEPYHTFYWLAAETGMRAGELCGLRTDDFDLKRGMVSVSQSVWRGKFQSTKSENAVRAFALSPQLAARLAGFLRSWRPNERRLLFATRKGTAWDANLLVKRKLYPLLDSLGIERGGLHAFRHANSTLMDRFNVPLKVRQERLGHSDPKLTLGVYTHVVSADDVRFAEQLGEILQPNGGILDLNGPNSHKEGVAPGEQPLVN